MAVSTRSAIAANGSPYGNPDAPDGSQVAAIEGNASVWRDVAFAETGNYTISFQTAYTNNSVGIVQRLQSDRGPNRRRYGRHVHTHRQRSFRGLPNRELRGYGRRSPRLLRRLDQRRKRLRLIRRPNVDYQECGRLWRSATVSRIRALDGASSPADITAVETRAAGTLHLDAASTRAPSRPTAVRTATRRPDGSQVAAIEGNATVWRDVAFAETGNYTISFLTAYNNNPGCRGLTAPIRSRSKSTALRRHVHTHRQRSFRACRTESFALRPASTACPSSA